MIALDVCRGFMLLSMACNHLVAFPFIDMGFFYQWLMSAAHGTYGFLSNSEGFFFLAGLTAGIVYGQLLLQAKETEMKGRIWKRIKQMYGIYAILLIILALSVAWSQAYLSNWKALHSLIWVWIDQPGIHYFLDHPLAGCTMGLVFLYQIPFLDLFPLYISLLAVTPWLLNRLKKGQVFYLLVASIACYIGAQYDPGIVEQMFAAYLPVKFAWFRLSAIQILFVTGLTLGFFYVRGKLPNIHRIFIATLVVCATLSVFFVFMQGIQSSHSLGILRLSLFSVKAYTAFLISRFLTFQWLALLGKHALAVFTYHIVLIFFLIFYLSEISALPLSLKFMALGLALTTLCVPAHILERKKAKLLQVAS